MILDLSSEISTDANDILEITKEIISVPQSLIPPALHAGKNVVRNTNDNFCAVGGDQIEKIMSHFQWNPAETCRLELFWCSSLYWWILVPLFWVDCFWKILESLGMACQIWLISRKPSVDTVWPMRLLNLFSTCRLWSRLTNGVHPD